MIVEINRAQANEIAAEVLTRLVRCGCIPEGEEGPAYVKAILMHVADSVLIILTGNADSE